LIVEDAPSIRKLMRVYLEQLGCEVDEAADGQEAIKRVAKDLPILVVSARILPLDRAHAEEAGASAYLTKPFTRALFAEQVRALIPHCRPD